MQKTLKMKRIAIFASGSGTNAQNIAEYFKEKPKIEVSCILSNNKNAYVLQRADILQIPAICFSREELYNSDNILRTLKRKNIDLIVLAGFLWMIPDYLLKNFPDRIINIHPALLPKYGGKGMYGKHVHNAVVSNNEKKSGISIHFVNEKYDEGKLIFQKEVELSEKDTAEMVAEKVHKLEYEYYPGIIEKVLENIN